MNVPIAITLAMFIPLVAAAILLRRLRRKAPARQKEKREAQNLNRWSTAATQPEATTTRARTRKSIRHAA
jgi:hypothetical protein